MSGGFKEITRPLFAFHIGIETRHLVLTKDLGSLWASSVDICKDLLPASGNRSNHTHETRGGPGNDRGDQTRRDRTKGERRALARKLEARKTWSKEERRLDDGLQSCIILIFSSFYEVSQTRSEIKQEQNPDCSYFFHNLNTTRSEKNPQCLCGVEVLLKSRRVTSPLVRLVEEKEEPQGVFSLKIEVEPSCKSYCPPRMVLKVTTNTKLLPR
ncbi:hypothetical protein TNCV_4947861 [Trichonephila clavipes]|nr:hypothetical protein TNCV_4947861 [Trichonephila clavipes]